MTAPTAVQVSLDPPDRLVLPEPLGAQRPARSETQRWQRLGRAEGELILGYSDGNEVVRVEYHWIRRLSLADPEVGDVYTAELWARRPCGDWAYLIRPGEPRLHLVEHARLRPLLLQHLGVDIGAAP